MMILKEATESYELFIRYDNIKRNVIIEMIIL